MRFLPLILFSIAIANAEDKFFPPEIWNSNVDQNDAQSNSYIKSLKAAKEESLMNLVEKSKGKADKIYRLTILRSFHNPIIVTLDVNKKLIILKVLNGKGGYDPGKLIEECKANLSVDSINEIEGGLNGIEYRGLPTVLNEPKALNLIKS